ncbi:MAG TPA: cytochrome c [Steroidobacteraceae bacterium]|nr:cytochrome c [Steroidobacteraceae bacterium]
MRLRTHLPSLTGLTVVVLALAAHGQTPKPTPPATAAPPISWTPATVVVRPDQPRGYVQFQLACAVCHGAGAARPGTRALAVKYQGKLPARLEERTDLSADYVRTTVRHGVSVMPFFRKTELSDAELEAIVAYLTRKRG